MNRFTINGARAATTPEALSETVTEISSRGLPRGVRKIYQGPEAIRKLNVLAQTEKLRHMVQLSFIVPADTQPSALAAKESKP